MSWNQPGNVNSSSQGVPIGAAPVYDGYSTNTGYPPVQICPAAPVGYPTMSSSSGGVPIGAAPVSNSWSNGAPVGYTDQSAPVWTSSSSSVGMPIGTQPVGGYPTYSSGQPIGQTMNSTSYGMPIGQSNSSSVGVPLGATYTDGTVTSSSTGAPLGAYPNSGY